jgi:phosphoribosylformimino-5-aminoimidazole carboxamide ribotide isomerase
VDGWGVAALFFTAIERDGTREGPDVAATAALQASVRCDVIASGGVGTLDHLRALHAAGVRAAVCGRALYSGAFTLAEAFAAARGEATP